MRGDSNGSSGLSKRNWRKLLAGLLPPERSGEMD